MKNKIFTFWPHEYWFLQTLLYKIKAKNKNAWSYLILVDFKFLMFAPHDAAIVEPKVGVNYIKIKQNKTKILEHETLTGQASQVPIAGGIFFHFPKAFLWTSQPIWHKSHIKKCSEMIVLLFGKFIFIKKHITNQQDIIKNHFQITMFKDMFWMLRWPTEATPKS